MTKIILADEEANQREFLAEIIGSAFRSEIQLRMAENGRQVVDLAGMWHPDIILTDIILPELSGLEAARQVLEYTPGCRVIFITAYSLFRYAHEAIRLGACGYILKPADPDEVIRTVRRAIGQPQARQSAPASDRTPAAADKSALLMEKVQKHVQYNYMYDLSLDAVSSLVNMNASYFSATFKRHFGVNFVDYLTDLRIQAAKELLTDPLRTTAEISAMVGYESPNYFARAFKKKTGMTPTQYRRTAQP